MPYFNLNKTCDENKVHAASRAKWEFANPVDCDSTLNVDGATTLAGTTVAGAFATSGASGTITSSQGITASAGNITSSAGDVNAGQDVIATRDISAGRDLKVTRNFVHTATNGQATSYLMATALKANTDAVGATITCAGMIPAGAFVIGAEARVTTEITGCTSWQLGITGTTGLFGTGIALAAGTTVSSQGGTATGSWSAPTLYKTATDVLLTAVGGGTAWTTGAVRVTIHYITITPATS